MGIFLIAPILGPVWQLVWISREAHLHPHWSSTQVSLRHPAPPTSLCPRILELERWGNCRTASTAEKWGGSGKRQEQFVPTGICSLRSLYWFRLCLASYKQKQNNERKEYQEAPGKLWGEEVCSAAGRAVPSHPVCCSRRTQAELSKEERKLMGLGGGVPLPF
jgi:hypothetical protein